jgi:hypothetical protein
MFICICWSYLHIEMPQFMASQPLQWEPQILIFKSSLYPYLHIEMPQFMASQPLLWEPQILIFNSSLYPSVKRKKGLSFVVQVQLFGSHIQMPPCVPVCEFPNVEMVMV